jgi:hypothetical protein
MILESSYFIIVVAEAVVQLLYGLLLLAREHVAVSAQRNADAAMAQGLPHYVGRNAHAEHDRRRQVPRAMKAHAGQPCIVEHFFEDGVEPKLPHQIIKFTRCAAQK